MRTRTVLAAMSLALLFARRSDALFHLAVIDEVMSGISGDATAQFVEIRMLAAGQGVVQNSRLTFFSCMPGNPASQLLLVPSNVSNSQSGARWIMATPSFAAATCIAPDFVFQPGIDAACGQICWGAPGLVPPNPSTWDLTNPNNYVDCIAYGGYAGPVPAGGSSSPSPAGTGTQSLTRGQSGFALAAPTPMNNAGQTGTIGVPCPSTTTTTGGPSTTTTTTLALPPPLRGGGSAKTDCFGEWSVVGASGPGPVVRCRDGDATCDRGTGAGCVLQAAVCFYGRSDRCEPAAVTAFSLTGTGSPAGAILDVVDDLGGQLSGTRVTFLTPIANRRCTALANIPVALRTRGSRSRPGKLLLRSSTVAGRTDADKLRVICTP